MNQTKKTISQFELTNYILTNINQDNSPLNSSEFVVLVVLSKHINSTSLKCNPAKTTLANMCFLSERTVDAAVKGLLSKGFITYVKGGIDGRFKRPNSYAFVYDKIYSYTKTEWVADEFENAMPAKAVAEVVMPKPAEAVVAVAKAPNRNPDGSMPYHCNGTRCYSYEDHAKAAEGIEEENAGDFPW